MADFLVLGDYPAVNDGTKQFRDNAGRMLWHLLYTQGFPVNDTAVEFLYNSVHDIKFGSDQWRSIEAKHKPKVILALGQQVCKVLGIEGKLFDNRGSVFTLPRKSRTCYVIPTFAPRELKKPLRMFADEKLEKSYFAGGDVKRAVRAYNYGWQTPPERFNLTPTIQNVRDFVKEAQEDRRLLGTDLEATGLNLEYAKIVTIGMAWNQSDAIVIPLLREGGREYWSQVEKKEVIELLNSLFNSNKFMFQNGVGYDVPLLRQNGFDFPLESFTEDTMIYHHILSPEQPHRIGFISSQYGSQPFWKDSFLTKKVSIFETNQLEMRRYNARDCIALFQIMDGMRQDMEERIQQDELYKGLPKVYENAIKVSRVVIKMYEKGIKLDKGNLSKWQKLINDEVQQKEARLCSLAKLPPSFNLGSSDQMRLLLYAERPRNIEGVLEKLAKYDEKCMNYQYECAVCSRKVTKKHYDSDKIPKKKIQRCPACKKEQVVHRTEKEPTPVKSLSKDTNKYRELKQLEDLASTAPLYKLSNFDPLTTPTGSSAIDKSAITRYIVFIDKRMATLESMRRRLPKHDIEEKGLKKTRKFLVAFSEYGTVKKLQESFYQFPTWRDGQVRPNYLVTGTATGRFSAKNPNLMQIPSKEWGVIIRSCFRADPGSVLLSVDFTGLEVEIGARVMGDRLLMGQLEKGLNMHDENTKIFFDATKKSKHWKDLRGASKIILFGRLLYGGSDPGIFSQVITAVPNSGITLKSFKEAIANYAETHVDYQPWVEKVQAMAKERRLSVNAYGRVRTLLGDSRSIERIALNNPIQGSAADLMISDMIEID